ncbi:hypothetical protein DPEC_G00234610 [Dallia pectoralis]|uniref:Uncharacterized protein n=1 Tax=Dallia pectoralis TaxID=75939 RepID=A0ACC2FXY4_DALPE|nr:hypothetical protein DPEC_G00234610 [Dallia pectoralis]
MRLTQRTCHWARVRHKAFPFTRSLIIWGIGHSASSCAEWRGAQTGTDGHREAACTNDDGDIFQQLPLLALPRIQLVNTAGDRGVTAPCRPDVVLRRSRLKKVKTLTVEGRRRRRRTFSIFILPTRLPERASKKTRGGQRGRRLGVARDSIALRRVPRLDERVGDSHNQADGRSPILKVARAAPARSGLRSSEVPFVGVCGTVSDTTSLFLSPSLCEPALRTCRPPLACVTPTVRMDRMVAGARNRLWGFEQAVDGLSR